MLFFGWIRGEEIASSDQESLGLKRAGRKERETNEVEKMGKID